MYREEQPSGNNNQQKEPPVSEKIKTWSDDLLIHTRKQLNAQRMKLLEDLKKTEGMESAKIVGLIKELASTGRTIEIELKKRGIEHKWD